MRGCAKKQHDCDDAILDRLNGVDNIKFAERRCCGKCGHQDDNAGLLSDQYGNCWQHDDVCRNRQRSVCDFCWLWPHCPYGDSDRFRD